MFGVPIERLMTVAPFRNVVSIPAAIRFVDVRSASSMMRMAMISTPVPPTQQRGHRRPVTIKIVELWTDHGVSGRPQTDGPALYAMTGKAWIHRIDTAVDDGHLHAGPSSFASPKAHAAPATNLVWSIYCLESVSSKPLYVR